MDVINFLTVFVPNLIVEVSKHIIQIEVIFDTLAKAMIIKESVKGRLKRSEKLPRMSDYAVWCEAISQSIGNKEGQFLDAYYHNLNLQNDEVIESSVVAKVMIALMGDRSEWRGSVTDLHSILTSALSDKDERLARSKSCPNSANSLSREINELSSTLKKRGIEIFHSYDSKTKSRVIRCFKPKLQRLGYQFPFHFT